MATTIKLKNGSGAPLAGDLVQGEPALDLTNKRLYTEDSGGTVIEVGTNPSTIDINAGTIDGTVIGGSSAAAGTFTTFTSTGIDDNATSTAITIDSSENVGIGTASPGAPLDVAGAIRCTTGFQMYDSGSVGRGIVVMSGDDPVFQTGTTAGTRSLLFKTEDTERMRIDSSGRTLIGTTSADQDAKLTVVGSGAGGSSPATISTNTVATFRRTGGVSHSANVSILAGSTGFSVLNLGDRDDEDVGRLYYDHTNNAMLFDTNAAERMRIQTDGQVLIGTSSILSGGIDGLHLNTVGGDTGITFGYSGTTIGWLYYIVGAAMQLQTPTGTTIRMVSDSNGVQLTNGATSWSALSDERKKDIIEPITNAAEKVSTLRTVIGKYKEEDEGTRRAFLIAQDVQKVLPEAVGENDDGDLLLQYTETIPLLVAAIKEQQAQITELKAEVAALKGA